MSPLPLWSPQEGPLAHWGGFRGLLLGMAETVPAQHMEWNCSGTL